MSFQKKMSTAMIAPTWMTAVNAVMDGSSMDRPSILATMVRCPVEETGRNSVRPSTMPRMIACRIVMRVPQPVALPR